MKNLLKSVMLVLLIVPIIGCESESIDMVNQDQSGIDRESSFSTNEGPCDDMQIFTKFVNNGSHESDFMIYDSEGEVLTSKLLAPNQTSDIDAIISFDKVNIIIRNSEDTFRKNIGMKTCVLYTIMIDADDNFTMYMSEL